MKEQPHWCFKFGCNNARLVFLEVGESRQTNNGFLIARIAGYYCPVCAGSYGPYERNKKRGLAAQGLCRRQRRIKKDQRCRQTYSANGRRRAL